MNYQSNNGFNSALLINVEKQDPPSVSPPSLSPRLNNQSENTSSIYNYLPSDLITKIDTLSPAQRDLSPSSQHMSDIEMKSNEDKKSLSFFHDSSVRGCDFGSFSPAHLPRELLCVYCP